VTSEPETSEPMARRPAAGCWAFTAEAQGASVAFAGRGAAGNREEVLAGLTGQQRQVAWARQIHSARVLRAHPGECGEGDALVSHGSAVALSIVTADCVPVLLAGPQGIAAVHAGWRGIAAGVVPAAIEALGEAPSSLTSWIGPAIGPCCYETGPDVAAKVAAASDPAIVAEGPNGRPYLDLQLAVRRQLETAGLHQVQVIPLCTRCAAATLHSYRRDGKAGGRNHAFIWRQ
jgi:YfiH family protein